MTSVVADEARGFIREHHRYQSRVAMTNFGQLLPFMENLSGNVIDNCRTP